MPDRPLRAVVVDDERLARRELRALLAAEPVEVVGEAVDADAADTLLARLDADGAPPDVLFLDVQMPERTGFDLLDGLAEAGRAVPDVVFVTAYDEHALRAFRVSAVDYLLKPVDPAALAEAVARVAARRADAPEAPAPTGRLGADDRVFVKDGDRMHLVRIGDVRRFESVGNYTQLHFRSAGGRRERAVVARSLTALEERLDPDVVVRASRADLVGLGHVVGVDEAPSGGLVVRLDDGQAVEFSRRRAQDLRDRLSL
jgi:two-component system LytT family response regulator